MPQVNEVSWTSMSLHYAIPVLGFFIIFSMTSLSKVTHLTVTLDAFNYTSMI